MSTTYNPLNGRELLEIHLADIRRMLEADNRYKEHLCYLAGEVKVEILMTTWPTEPSPLKKTVVSGVERESIEGKEPQIAKVSKSRKFGTDQSGAPDRLREEIGLPVPTMVREGDVTADKMVRKGNKWVT